MLPLSFCFRRCSSRSGGGPAHHRPQTTTTISRFLLRRLYHPQDTRRSRLSVPRRAQSLVRHHSSSSTGAAAAAACGSRSSTSSSSNNNNNNSKHSSRTQWRQLAWLAGGTTTAAAAAYAVHYFHDHFGGTEGLGRALQFYSVAIPKYFEYRFHQWRESPDHVWDELDRETSATGLEVILRLKGFYVKCGQLCAANIGNGFPPIWQETMSVLQDAVPPEDFETVIRPILQQELDYDRIFASFDPVPMGSASIGQVHRAALQLTAAADGDGKPHHQQRSHKNDTTTPVVVKVCYPHVERLLRGDVRTIRAFCEVAQPVHVPGIKEVEKQFPSEFDYRTEAAHLEQVRNNLQKAGLEGTDRLCRVPQPYPQYCTKHVLVMEELRGEKLVDALRKDAQRWASLMGMNELDLLAAAQQQVGTSRSAMEMSSYIAAVDAKRRLHNAWARLYNSTVGLLTNRRREYQSKEELPLNHAQIVDDLLHIHGHEVLVDGCYNADCHPGNILLCRKSDGSPQLGLIDYGQVQHLNKEQRHLFCRIIIALDDDDREEVVRLMKEAGFQSERMDPEVIFTYAKVSYDQDSKELTNGKHIQMFMEDLQSRDPIKQLPEKYMMIGRTSILLRGLAHALKQSRSVAKHWRPIAERVLKENI